jgi:CRP/FNR family cyclic AMP-dependent transcriptional regulator
MTINISLLDQALAFGRLVEYPKDATMHTRGEYAMGLSIVYSGQVRVGNYGLDGNYQLTTLLEKGETFGEFTLFANLPRTHNAEAVTDTQIIQMSIKQYNAFILEHPQAEKMLLGSLANKLHTALERLDDIQRLPTYSRLAKLLFQLGQRQQSTHLEIKQNQCAQLLGVTILSAHKALQKLQSLGLIKTAYGAIYIQDMAEMEAWLQQNSSILPVSVKLTNVSNIT